MKTPSRFTLAIGLWIALILSGMMLFMASCDRAITITPPAYDGKISIQSLITPGQPATVYVNRTVPYFDARVLARDLFLRSARVTMSSATGSEVLQPDSVFNPVRCELDYFFRGKQPVRANQTYTLTVQVNGATYMASATTSQRKVKLDQVGYVASFTDVYGDHEGIVLSLTDPAGTGDFYRYDLGRVIPDTVISAGKTVSVCTIGKPTFVRETGRTVYADLNNDGTPITFTVEPAYQHKAGQVGYVRLQTVDKAIYDFYDNLDRQKLAQFNPFVEPVFLKNPGQFGPNVFGVFGAYALSDSVRFVFPE